MYLERRKNSSYSEIEGKAAKLKVHLKSLKKKKLRVSKEKEVFMIDGLENTVKIS